MQTKICSGCGKRKLVKEFSINRKAKDGCATKCKVCDAQYYTKHAEKIKQQRKQYQKKHWVKISKRNKQYNKEKREHWLEFLHADQMKCQVCGYNKSFFALDFHHIIAKEKDFRISQFMQKAFTEKNQLLLLKELSKCMILCSNCHREWHVTQRLLAEKS